ncbi:MAG: hypothetical protein ACQEQC_06650 [Elusimicrobiota bacterium]
MSKEITCQECEQPIKKRSQLAVVGKNFLTFHRECYKNTSDYSQWKFLFGFYRINGPFTWILIAGFDFVFLLTFLVFNTNSKDLLLIMLFFNFVLLGMRLISYLAFETKLPKN